MKHRHIWVLVKYYDTGSYPTIIHSMVFGCNCGVVKTVKAKELSQTIGEKEK